MQLWAVSVIVYFISSLSCHLFTFLETATPWNKWPVLLSHGQGCFLQLITSRNATDRNAFRLFAKKTNISSLSENITFPQKVNCSVGFSGHVKFLLCSDRSLNRRWWHTVVAQDARQSLQPHMAAGSGTDAGSLFLTHPAQGYIPGCGHLWFAWGWFRTFSLPFTLLRIPPEARQMQCSVCQPLLFTSQKWQPEPVPSRSHKSPSLQTHNRKSEESHISALGFRVSSGFSCYWTQNIGSCRLTSLSLRGKTRVQAV